MTVIILETILQNMRQEELKELEILKELFSLPQLEQCLEYLWKMWKAAASTERKKRTMIVFSI